MEDVRLSDLGGTRIYGLNDLRRAKNTMQSRTSGTVCSSAHTTLPRPIAASCWNVKAFRNVLVLQRTPPRTTRQPGGARVRLMLVGEAATQETHTESQRHRNTERNRQRVSQTHTNTFTTGHTDRETAHTDTERHTHARTYA